MQAAGRPGLVMLSAALLIMLSFVVKIKGFPGMATFRFLTGAPSVRIGQILCESGMLAFFDRIKRREKALHFIDPRFRENKFKYIAQCAMVVVVMFIVLATLDARKNSAVIAALGASSFIAFTMPHSRVSSPRYLLGGYLIGVITGTLCHFAAAWASGMGNVFIQEWSTTLFGALAVGIVIFIMVITDFEHPPAAGVALGLCINECTISSVSVVVIGIVLLTGIKTVLKRKLLNLL